MDIIKYEVVIVGGGPSGATAGKLLAKNGISCCIIDKESFPRHKLCAGALTDKTIELLGALEFIQDISKFYNNSTNKINMYYKYDLAVSIETKTSYFLTDRIDFDNLLINDFLSNGGKLYSGTRISNIDFDNNEIILSTNKKIKFQYIVGADGANSYLRRFINKDYKPNGFCIEIDLPKDNTMDNSVNLYFGELKGNYGWVFPKNNHLTVGFGGILNKSIDYKEEFNKYLKKIFPEIEDYESVIKGHFLPFGNYVRVPISNKLLLVGDAAGLVDPVTGEGIYFSLLSGKYAAEAIIERLEGKSDNFHSYLTNLKEIHKIIDDGVLFQKLFYNSGSQKVIFQLIKNHKNFVGYVFENLASYYNYNYMNIPKLVIDYKFKHK